MNSNIDFIIKTERPIITGSIILMPTGPLVTLTGWSKLFKNILMISPNQGDNSQVVPLSLNVGAPKRTPKKPAIKKLIGRITKNLNGYQIEEKQVLPTNKHQQQKSNVS